MVIKCIKFIFGNGRILSGFGYIAVGWIIAQKKILCRRISVILGLKMSGSDPMKYPLRVRPHEIPIKKIKWD